MTPRPKPLAEIATQGTIEYTLDRSLANERKHPLLALIYRVVAEVLREERAAYDERVGTAGDEYDPDEFYDFSDLDDGPIFDDRASD